MVEPETEELEKLLAAMRAQSKKDHRQLEKNAGVALVFVSLFMVAVFIVALRYSSQNRVMMVMSIFFLVVAVILFSRGLRDALFGKGKKAGGR